MNKQLVISNNDSSFRTTFNKILSGYEVNNISLKNCFTKRSYNMTDKSDLFEHLQKIRLKIPYKKICITYDFETGKKEIHIECKPFLGSA